jgi:O-antigen/teichoic acid export membrane protein
MWNLLGAAWVGLVILFATPWYVSLLDLEGYGILSFWLVLQVMMGLFDMGLGATLTKEFAKARQSANRREFMRDLLRTVEIVYWAVSILLALSLFTAAGWVSDHWLKPNALPRSFVEDGIRMMAIALALQFPYGLYSQGLAGLQEQGRLNALQIAGHTLRYGMGVVVLLWRADLVLFFAVQALVAALQTLATRAALWRMISGSERTLPAFRMRLLRQSWRYSLGMALTSVSALLLANIDRLALSTMLPTSELGKYAVAFTATGLLQLGIQPFYRAFFPRYVEFIASGQTERLQEEYFRSCQLAAVVLIPSAVIAGVFAPYLFDAWLRNHDATMVDVFRLLLIGITTSALAYLPAAFQQAHGWTRLHVAMILGAIVVGVPLMIWAIRAYGAVGATTVWVIHGLSDITLGLWLMHRRLLIGQLLAWYRSVPLPPLLVSIPLAYVSFWLLPSGMNRWITLCWIIATGLVLVVVILCIPYALRASRSVHSN